MWVTRVRVSEVIPGWVHKCVHGVSLSPGWAFTPNRRQGVGKGTSTTKRIITRTNDRTVFVSLLKWQIVLMCVMCVQIWLDVPAEKHSWGHTGSGALVPAPWPTGCANRGLTDRSTHMNMCLCWKCHFVPLAIQAKQRFGTWWESAKHYFHSEGEDIHKDSLKALDFFLLRFLMDSTKWNTGSICLFTS